MGKASSWDCRQGLPSRLTRDRMKPDVLLVTYLFRWREIRMKAKAAEEEVDSPGEGDYELAEGLLLRRHSKDGVLNQRSSSRNDEDDHSSPR